MLPIKSYSKQTNPCTHEPTVSGRIYVRIIMPWQAQEYVVKLFFLQWLSPEIAIARVRQSAAPGRLNMAEERISALSSRASTRYRRPPEVSCRSSMARDRTRARDALWFSGGPARFVRQSNNGVWTLRRGAVQPSGTGTGIRSCA